MAVIDRDGIVAARPVVEVYCHDTPPRDQTRRVHRARHRISRRARRYRLFPREQRARLKSCKPARACSRGIEPVTIRSIVTIDEPSLSSLERSDLRSPPIPSSSRERVVPLDRWLTNVLVPTDGGSPRASEDTETLPSVRLPMLFADGKLVATGSSDKTARIFEASTGREVSRFPHQGLVSAVAFSLDGKKIATAGDKTIRVWNADSGDNILIIDNVKQLPAALFFTLFGLTAIFVLVLRLPQRWHRLALVAFI